MSNKKKILIYGIGSLQNRGCEALVNSTISQIDKNIDLVAATFDYDYDKNMYKERIKKFIPHHRRNEDEFNEEELKEYEKIKRMPFDYYNYECLYQRDVIKEMETSDICIHIGGDNYCYGVNEWMYTINRKAKELNKKTVLWGASLFDELNDLNLINDLKKYDLLILREKISYNAIKKYIQKDKLMLVPDPAFSLKPKKVNLNSFYKSGKILGLNLSPLTVKSEKNLEHIKLFINYVLQNTDYKISLIPHVTLSEVSDLKILEPLKKEYKNNDRIYLENGDYNCQEIKYIISKCDILVASRTHASIAAYSSLVPTLVIGYSVKSRGIAEDIFGSYKNYVIPTEELTEKNIIKKFKYIDENKNDIVKILKDKMKQINKDAASIYKRMMERLDYLDKKTICTKNKCVGCAACLNACPVNAISMVENEEGFLYPEIDLDKCINCDNCRKVCCINNKIDNVKNDINLNCYAAKSKNEDVKLNSSSGGIFYYIAQNIIDRKGIVYGASMSEFKVNHIRIDKIDDIEKIQGSKYSQSNLLDTFKKVKEDLLNDKLVLFSGTPCQILGLKTYLKEEYENLYTVSVICHGVINNKLLNKRIHEFESQFESNVSQVIYKSKKNGWDKSSIEFISERINKAYMFNDDYLMYLFINNYILRESCYECPAKGLDNNKADIILGDYWGVYNVHQEFFDTNGVSAVIIRTIKGNKLFDNIKNKLELLETNYGSIIQYNESFINSSNRPLYRDEIFIDMNNNTLKVITQKCNLMDDAIKNEEIEKLIQEKTLAEERLAQICSSKRFQLVDKIGNILTKLKK